MISSLISTKDKIITSLRASATAYFPGIKTKTEKRDRPESADRTADAI